MLNKQIEKLEAVRDNLVHYTEEYNNTGEIIRSIIQINRVIVELKNEQTGKPKVLYLCDHKKCKDCGKNLFCEHTDNIDCAVNFTKLEDGVYAEKTQNKVISDYAKEDVEMIVKRYMSEVSNKTPIVIQGNKIDNKDDKEGRDIYESIACSGLALAIISFVLAFICIMILSGV